MCKKTNRKGCGLIAMLDSRAKTFPRALYQIQNVGFHVIEKCA